MPAGSARLQGGGGRGAGPQPEPRSCHCWCSLLRSLLPSDRESVCCLSEILKQVRELHSRDSVPFSVGYTEPYFPNEFVAKELSITDVNEEARNQYWPRNDCRSSFPGRLAGRGLALGGWTRGRTGRAPAQAPQQQHVGCVLPTQPSTLGPLRIRSLCRV